MRRVTVHTDNDTISRTIDLAVPATVCLDEVLPSIVGMAYGGAPPSARWRLRRVGGSPLDESLSLRDNRVDDGELLWLTADEVPEPAWSDRDGFHTAATQLTDGPVPPLLWVAVSVSAAALAAAALASAARTAAPPVAIAAVVAAAAAAGALVAHRARPEQPLLVTTVGMVAVMFGAISGALAVPAGPVAAHVLLASAAAMSVATLLLRLTIGAATPLTATAVAALLTSAASAVALAGRLDAGTAAAILATLSVVTLGAAPRIAMVVARIGPAPPDVDEPEIVDRFRAALAHETLTGLVTGATVTTSAAVLLLAGTGHSAPPATALAVALGAILLLRARTHVGTGRRCVLIVGGFVCLAAGLAMTVTAAPEYAAWIALVALAGGLAATAPLLGMTAGPGARRAADVAECLVLAAAVPLACWIAGVYGLVRDAGLS
ncbi:type VII secretion integral membrane protein EccD [Mycolicibacterium rutilum]|uniref:Type VII secretion integral membrane protein EccD n=2 Tax=Mycolicibacterium rutilum TaxID=370526 RepID=A0A1H6M5Q5_MYCRU|nr:type VII secretion integral membrane protein EccD [Mycolicibacterium rutilum]